LHSNSETGYETFFPKVGDYELKGAPTSWTNVVAVRHALTKFPDCKFVWFLDQNAFIMNPELTVEEHIMKPAKLEGLMIKDHPVVPPDSIIKTFSHLKSQDVDFVVTQDKEGISASSYVIRNGDWARFFLETWFDPLYRSYNFQRAETHALVSYFRRCVRTRSNNESIGAYCPMAPHCPCQTGSRSTKDSQHIQQSLKGRRVPGGRLCCYFQRLHLDPGMRH
jgi:hypothetical protein